jgi:hypothetical protein
LPGGHGHRVNYDFPNGTPSLLKVVFAVFFTNTATILALGFWESGWAPRQPSAYYSYAIRFKGGVVVYVPQAIGLNDVWGFWGGFVLLAVIGLLFWYYERTGRAVRQR